MIFSLHRINMYMLLTLCGRRSMKRGAMILGIYFIVNFFWCYLFFISKTRFYQDVMPISLAAGTSAIGTVHLFANAARFEVAVKDMLQTFSGRYSLKTRAVIIGIFFTVNALVILFVGFFFFSSKTRFEQDEMPIGLAAGSLALGAVELFANVALVEGAMKRSYGRLVVWLVTHSVLLCAYTPATAVLFFALLHTAPLTVLDGLCPQVIITLIVLLTMHGGLQVYALVVVESLRRKFLMESPAPSMDIAYQKLERYYGVSSSSVIQP